MADWRYEGIICGYLELYRASGSMTWLARAMQAGDDLVAAQLPSGKYRNSSFEHGPMEGGTPHEAAADIGLLELAQVLRSIGNPAWKTYADAARHNIQEYQLLRLWNGQGFRDQPWNNTLVPNKNATTLEALLVYETVFEEDMSEYIEPSAKFVMASQEATGSRAGCTVHHGTGRHRLGIGIYTARSASGILRLYLRQPRDELLAWVSRALDFLEGLCNAEAVYFGRYPDGSLIANPRLIAGVGDMLRAAIMGSRLGIATESLTQKVVEWLLTGHLASGGISTGTGFRWRGGRSERHGLPDFRDLLPVVGWCDKAFRGLAMISPPLEGDTRPTELGELEAECAWKGHACVFREVPRMMTLTQASSGKVLYRWQKGHLFPEIYLL